MRIAALFSGGKDSTFALYWAIKKGHEVKCLMTLSPKRKDSYMFHFPNIEFAKYQAGAMGIPILTASTSGEKEKELEDLIRIIKKAKKKYRIEGVAAGAVASEYQKTRVEKICSNLGLECLAPYWKANPEEYMKSIIDSGFEVIITGVYAEGLTPEMLGQRIDSKMLDKLIQLNKKYKIHIAGEGGEYETFVADAPIFKKRIVIEKAEKVMETKSTGYLRIMKVRLEKKI